MRTSVPAFIALNISRQCVSSSHGTRYMGRSFFALFGLLSLTVSPEAPNRNVRLFTFRVSIIKPTRSFLFEN